MPTLSIRLSEDLESRLDEEARRRGTKRSELAREVLAGYVRRQERERFMAELDRAARFLSRHPEEAAGIAEEFLPLDVEALDLMDEPVRQAAGRRPARAGGSR